VNLGQAEFDLGLAESIVYRSRDLYRRVWSEAKRMPEYRCRLATRERCTAFEAKLLRAARKVNNEHAQPLAENIVAEVTARVARTIADWEHSPIRQRARQGKQVASRHQTTAKRDREILDRHLRGESLAAIAREVDMTREGVRKVLLRVKPRPTAVTDTDDTRAVG